MMIVKGDVVKACPIQDRARVLIAEDRGITFDEGVQPLLLDQVGRDPLDLVGGAAVER